MNTSPHVVARRRGFKVALWIAFGLLLAFVLAAVAFAAWVGDLGVLMPIHVVIDGDETWTFDPDVFASLHPVKIRSPARFRCNVLIATPPPSNAV